MPVPAGGSPGGRELSRREAEIANSYEIEGLPSISEVRRFHKIPSLSNGRKTSVKTWSIGGARGPAAQARPEAQKRAGNQEVVHEGLVLKRGRIFSAFQVSSELSVTIFFVSLPQQVDHILHAHCAGSTLHALPKLAYIFKVDVQKTSRSCKLWTWARDKFRQRAASRVKGRRGTLRVFSPGSGSSGHALCSSR